MGYRLVEPLKNIRLKDPSQRLYRLRCAALLESERVLLKIAKFGSIH